MLQQTRTVRGAGAALPRCLGPRSADLKRAPSNFSKSGRDGRRGAAAQHTHYGAVHMDAGQPRAMRSSSAPPWACSARSRAPHALSSRFSPRFSSRFSERQTRAIFPPKKISTIPKKYQQYLHGGIEGVAACDDQRAGGRHDRRGGAAVLAGHRVLVAVTCGRHRRRLLWEGTCKCCRAR